MKQNWPINQMAETFLCPGLVIRMPSSRGTKLFHIDYCYPGCHDVTNLNTGKPSMLTTDSIRQCAVLVGTNFKVTKP